MSLYNHQILKKRRQGLRKNQTEAEDALWKYLRGRKVKGIKFYRQYSVGVYILDFYCPKIRLGIELDGSSHKDKIEYDQERDNFIKSQNINILRFANGEVLANIKKVIEKIKQKIEDV